MPNKLYNNPHESGPGGRSTSGMSGKPASMPFREKVSYPGASLPGKGGPSRDKGTPRTGKTGGGPFYVDSKGLG